MTQTMPQAQTAATLPQPVQAFLDLTRALTSLLSQENALLQEQRPADISPLAGKKMRLTSEYRQALEVLKANEASLLGAPDSGPRQNLRLATEQFRQELAHNAKLIIRLKTITEGVVKSISTEVARQRNPMQHYSHTGQITTKGARPATLSFDRII